jgi:hypothetical protein
MNLKVKVFSVIFFTVIMLVSSIQLFDTYYFLPKTVLKINELPKSTEIIESGNNASIGTQLFVNQWLFGISTEQLPIILSGHQYLSCTGVSKGYIVADTLQRHKKFFYSNCYEFKDDSSNIRPLTRIFANSTDTELLVEYQTD